MTTEPSTKTAETPLGTLEYVDIGTGEPILFVHGSPGGCDQAELMTRFVAAAGFRVIAPSRPGYLRTPLTDANATPEAQSDMEIALLDALGVDRVSLMCWSGGGPSTYRTAATLADRVSKLVAIAAVSKPYTFAGGAEASLMEGKIGKWLIAEMAKHSPKSLIRSTVGEEGDLSKDELKRLTKEIWQDDTKREFVLALADTVAGRKVGLDNDHRQFPKLGDLGLATIKAPTLLVHGKVDTDVPPDHSDHAARQLPNAELLGVEDGTHIAVWTATTSDDVQARILDHLR
jgi:pimeloyl-ACP methyl ester carboxylesterase